MLLPFHPLNPFRALCWRWDRAGDILEGGKPLSRRRDDSWIQRAYRVRAELKKCKELDDFALAAANDPPVYFAYQLYQQKLDAQRKNLPIIVEARLLATEGFKEIADKTGLGEDQAKVVEAYAKLFFDVLGRQRHTDYIATMVMGPAAYTGLKARNYELIWKLFAWAYGPLMLDTLLNQRMNTGLAGDVKSLRAAIHDEGTDGQRVAGLIAIKTLEINSFNVMQVIQEFNRLTEIERAGGREGSAQQTILTNVEAMMEALPFRVGQNTPPGDVAGRMLSLHGLPGYDAGAAELRGDELMGVAVGEPPAALEHVHLLAFPPAPVRNPLGPGEVPALPAPESA